MSVFLQTVPGLNVRPAMRAVKITRIHQDKIGLKSLSWKALIGLQFDTTVKTPQSASYLLAELDGQGAPAAS